MEDTSARGGSLESPVDSRYSIQLFRPIRQWVLAGLTLSAEWTTLHRGTAGYISVSIDMVGERRWYEPTYTDSYRPASKTTKSPPVATA